MPKNDVTDLAEVRAEIERIKEEANAFGYSLQGDKLSELKAEIAKIREERKGKPLCFKRMYDASAPHCVVCDLAKDCGGESFTGEAPPPEEMRQERCLICDTGWLSVPETDEASGEVRNWGCTTPGCANTLIEQTKYEEPKDEPKEKPPRKPELKVEVKKPPRKRRKPKHPKKRRARRPDSELDQAIIDMVKAEGAVKSKRRFLKVIGGGQKHLSERIETLLQAKMLKHHPVDGYTIGKL